MVTHMKTTVELSDTLLARAKQLASQENTTLRALIEAGLRQVLDEHEQRRSGFQLRDAHFTGNGLQAEFHQGDWAHIRQAAYENHGG